MNLTADTATAGTLVRKAPKGQLIWTIAEVRTDGTSTSVRVRKISSSKGGLWYPISALFL